MQGGRSDELLIEDGESSIEDRQTNLRRQSESRCCKISPQNLVCISHAFSAWGDRMWHFAIGLYLVELTPGSLRLTAIYQLISTLSIILFGPLVGDWVDANPRLKVAQISLVIQNLAVIVCGVLLLIMLELEQHIQHPFVTLLEAVIIIVGSIADLSSVGTKIAVEKDWVVVIAGSDKALLAKTNSILRRIDLCCKILAPILVGQIMTYISKVAGVVLLAGWNVVSVFLEYYLLWKVFQSVSALSQKVFDTRHKDETEEGSSVDLSQEEPQGSRGSQESIENDDPGRGQNGTEALVSSVNTRVRTVQRKPGIFKRFKKRIITFKNGWNIYFRQPVSRPGLALASLYFTVISFGAITTGYAYTQCLSESILSIVRGVGSLFGVFATFVFPMLRNAVGVVRCGLVSMSLQFSCLLLCVAAVFAPGSPFFLLPQSLRVDTVTHQCTATLSSSSLPQCGEAHLPTPMVTPTFQRMVMTKELANTSMSSVLPSSSRAIPSYHTVYVNSTVTPTSSLVKSSFAVFINASKTSSTSTIFPTVTPTQSCSNATEAPTFSKAFSYVSIALLLAGIVTSRLGLWMSDLAITQLFQETVPEQERGIVAGMQKSFNSLLGLIMFGLVIALPKPEHFGLLTLMSVCAVGTGGLLYASFAYKIRGHLFHLEKLRVFCGGSTTDNQTASRLQDDLDLEDDEEEAMIRGALSTRNENFKY